MNHAMIAQLAVPTGSSDAYIQAINRIPKLSADEEKALAERFRQENDLDAARALVMSNVRYVVQIARGYRGYGLPLGDLIQEGNIGLMKAVKRFDPSIGVRLISFAVHWIRAEIHEFVLRNWRIVKVATTKAQRKLFFNLRGAKKRLGWLNTEEVNDVAAELGVSPRDVMQMEERLSAFDPTFDGSPMIDEDDAAIAPAGYLEDLRYEPESQVETKELEGKNHELLQEALGSLDKRSQDIIAKRWLDEDKVTLQELAKQYKVSAERIRQLEANAMKRLKLAMQVTA
ncbi:MAG: RNA polymerase sigma factor RpoH [Gammaproteobacteria bacterium]|nr:RNA polymerase sigma factor RpoH [Gammaproteobacteria bacterium]